jgi:plasmid stabilization system protein ParE
MTPRFFFRPEARDELRAAQDWYEARSEGLGLEFARAVDGIVAAIARAPLTFPQVHGPVRRALMRRFPYQVLFLPEGDAFVIVACFHHRRDPLGWRSRS